MEEIDIETDDAVEVDAFEDEAPRKAAQKKEAPKRARKAKDTPAGARPKKERKEAPKEVPLDAYVVPQLVKHGIAAGMEKKLPAVDERYGVEEVERVIEQEYGVVTAIANRLDCTYKQFYNFIEKYGLQKKLEESKRNIVSVAETILLNTMLHPDPMDPKMAVEAAKFTLSRLGKGSGWSADDSKVAAVQVDIAPDERRARIRALFGIPTQDGDAQGVVDV